MKRRAQKILEWWADKIAEYDQVPKDGEAHWIDFAEHLGQIKEKAIIAVQTEERGGAPKENMERDKEKVVPKLCGLEAERVNRIHMLWRKDTQPGELTGTFQVMENIDKERADLRPGRIGWCQEPACASNVCVQDDWAIERGPPSGNLRGRIDQCPNGVKKDDGSPGGT